MSVIDDQPVSRLEWIERERLSANDWNPNIQAPAEHRLLKTSIMENGWTQPVVARRDGDRLEIVDGYHRWLVAEVPEVAALTGGLVPVVVLDGCPPDLARLATIRHNRARGTHHVVRMADLVAELQDLGMSDHEIGQRLQMDDEEVDRLADRGLMTKRGAGAAFNKGWTV